MKNLQLLLLIFALIGYCFTDDTDKCTTGFEQALKDKCEDINETCSYQPTYPEICISKIYNDCSNGDGDLNICTKIFHNDFPEKKCYYTSSNECDPQETVCSDFDNIIIRDIRLEEREFCSKFKSGNTQKICLLDNGLSCSAYYINCNGLSNAECTSNDLIQNYAQECYWEGDPSTGSCQSRQRICDPTLLNVKEDECDRLLPSRLTTENRKCIYSSNQCKAETSCENLVGSLNDEICLKNPPIIQKGSGTGYEFDYKHKCKFVAGSPSSTPPTQDKCILDTELRTCEEYEGSDPSICIGLKAKDTTNKRCVFKNRRCKEEYSTCEKYSENTLRKTKTECEGLKLLEENDKCIFNIEEDKCVTSTNYTTCEEYEGLSQVICESIKPSAHSRCILDKDSKCKERAFLCSEVFDSENCLYYATASLSNKRCAYDINYRNNGHDNICYEEYLRCEDYLGDDSDACENIKLYDGKKCKFDSKSNRCRTYNKTCSEAYSKEECKLIAKSGVSNPDKKVCLWLNERFRESGSGSGSVSYTYKYTCKETYKYCSDYREGNDYFCENYINPFIETEDKIEITSKCVKIGSRCYKVPKECKDAGTNPFLCSLISPKIKDNNKMYCAFIGGSCTLQFKKCEYWENLATSTYFPALPDCENTIPENYLDKPCVYKNINGENKCLTKDVCNVYSTAVNNPTIAGTPDITDIENLCKSVSHDCEYSSAGCTTKKEYSCQDIKFYKDTEENEEICKNITASEPYKICSLKDDRSGCEELINLEYTPSGTTTTTSEESKGFYFKGINFIIILLYLTF